MNKVRSTARAKRNVISYKQIIALSAGDDVIELFKELC